MDKPSLRGRRVLVVEDDYLVAMFVADALRDEEAQVLGPVGSLDEALDTVESGSGIDAAVLDVNLQGEPVFELADRLIQRNVPIVFTSGYDASFFPEAYRHLPMCMKPVDTAMLVDVVSRL